MHKTVLFPSTSYILFQLAKEWIIKLCFVYMLSDDTIQRASEKKERSETRALLHVNQNQHESLFSAAS